MKKLFIPILCCFALAYSNSLFGAAGTFEYYLNTSFNGTPKNHGDYSGGTSFDGSNLASNINLNSDVLTIDLAGLKTWQNGGDDISSATIFYRVYKNGDTPSGFTGQNLPWFQNLPSSGDKEWQNGADINLLTGITAVGTYTVEVYFQGLGTVSVYSSNGGANYKATFSVATPLPIFLTEFMGKNENGENLLTWATEIESNSALFEIEKSTTANLWTKIGSITAKGFSNRRVMYSFLDKAPNNVSYYRLKMLDRDGSFAYSKIVSINTKSSANIKLFPNPTTDEIKVNLGAYSVTYAKVQIVNMNGQVVLENNAIDNSPTSFSVSELQNGIYFVKIYDENKNLIDSEKFIKQ